MANATTPAVSPLRCRMIDDMTLRNLSPATQQSYLHADAKFSWYFNRSSERLALEEVRAFQVYLMSQGISWRALNQTVCALRFFYGVTLHRAEIPERIPYARTPRKLLTILSADEVMHFLEAGPSLKARAALTTAYAAGLRASEVVSLKVTDTYIDCMVGVLANGQRAARLAACAAILAAQLPEAGDRVEPMVKVALTPRPCPCCGRPMIMISVCYHGQGPPLWRSVKTQESIY